MDVTRHNFLELLPEIRENIKRAHLVSIDTELTGLYPASCQRSNLDSPDQVYQHVKAAANGMEITQFGISCFRWDEERQVYLAQPYNFWLFPMLSGNKRGMSPLERRKTAAPASSFSTVVNGKGTDTELQQTLSSDGGDGYEFTKETTSCRPRGQFICEAEALMFLSNHSFDFNKWISEGIPYLSWRDENAQIERAAQKDARGDIPIDDTNREFITETQSTIDKWMQNNEGANDDGTLMVKAGNPYLRRIVYQMIEKLNGFVVATTKNRDLELRRLTVEERKQRIEEEAAAKAAAKAAENVTVNENNFRQVIDALIESRVPLVGHNCYLDMVHLIQQFVDDLPQTLPEFKSLLHSIFPTLVDTKHLIVRHPSTSKIFADGSHLEQASNVLSSTVLATKVPIEYDEGFMRYIPVAVMGPDGEMITQSYYHEAGWDAYCTGLVCLRALWMIGMAKDQCAESNQSDVQKSTEPLPKDVEDGEEGEIEDTHSEEASEDMDTASDHESKTASDDCESDGKYAIDATSSEISEAVSEVPPLVQYIHSEDMSEYINCINVMYASFPYLRITRDDPLPLGRDLYFRIENLPSDIVNAQLAPLLHPLFGMSINIVWITETSAWIFAKDKLKAAEFRRTGLDGYDYELKKQYPDVKMTTWNDYWGIPVVEDVDESEPAVPGKRTERESTSESVKSTTPESQNDLTPATRQDTDDSIKSPPKKRVKV
ncbi:CAF1-domain-containing protein [Ramicandelaber brevisporus]|nr:CAF1-domain-containing protein [Ramicandelaber brevisporus]